LEEFDIGAFDALCVLVEDREYHNAPTEGEGQGGGLSRSGGSAGGVTLLTARGAPGGKGGGVTIDVKSGPALHTRPHIRSILANGIFRSNNGLIADCSVKNHENLELIQAWLLDLAGTEFTCFSGTKVQILTLWLFVFAVSVLKDIQVCSVYLFFW
jgi:hypothetical protein